MRLLSKNDSGQNHSVKISTQNVPRTIAFINNEFGKLYPDQIFSHRFLDEDFQQLYLEEKKAGQVILYLAVLAILIACMGILGLSSYTTKQRTKEVGIRRVVGASITNITLHLTKDFLKLVLLANILAWPAAFIIMNSWLKNFAYRIDTAWWMFIASGILTLIVAILTIGHQAFKLAVSNPVEALRYE